MSLYLRIHWVVLALFAGAALFARDPLIRAVPAAHYTFSIALFALVAAYWLGWLIWHSFGPGRRDHKPQKWLLLEPQIIWATQVPMLVAMGLVWPYADDVTLMSFAVFDTAAIAAIAFGSARLPPSRGFGSPIVLVLPVALMLFFLTQRPNLAWLGLWLGLMGIGFTLGRHATERLLNRAYEANRALAAERDAKARFLATASHDLAYPLQAARMFFDQTQQQREGPARDKAVRNVHWAFDTTEHLLRQIIEHLRLESGRVETRIEAIEVGPPIARTAEMNEPAARLAEVTLIALPSRLRAMADAAMIESILGNLVANAIRHAKARNILIGARRQAGRVRLWVIDDGCGVAPSDVPHLFDDYVQGSDHGDETRGGFGLGLASARRMAALMDGEVGLDPRWIRGSAFWLELPPA